MGRGAGRGRDGDGAADYGDGEDESHDELFHCRSTRTLAARTIASVGGVTAGVGGNGDCAAHHREGEDESRDEFFHNMLPVTIPHQRLIKYDLPRAILQPSKIVLS